MAKNFFNYSAKQRKYFLNRAENIYKLEQQEYKAMEAKIFEDTCSLDDYYYYSEQINTTKYEDKPLIIS